MTDPAPPARKIYTVRMPDGTEHDIEGPEGATEEDLAQAVAQLTQPQDRTNPNYDMAKESARIKAANPVRYDANVGYDKPQPLATTRSAVAPIPREMQAEWTSFTRDNWRHMTSEMASEKYAELLGKYPITDTHGQPFTAPKPDDFTDWVGTVRSGRMNSKLTPGKMEISDTQAMVNDYLDSPGSALASGALNTLSAGWADEGIRAIAGDNAANINAGIDANHPLAHGIGEVAGGAALPLAGPEAGIARMTAEGAAYGAASGAGNAQEGSRLSGAALGAGIGAAGGLIGGKFAQRQADKRAHGYATGPALSVQRGLDHNIDMPLGASRGGFSAAAEKALDIAPGSASVMQQGRDRLSSQVLTELDRLGGIAGNTSGNVGMGMAVQRGVKAGIKREKDQASKFYDAIQIAPEQPASLTNTIAKLEEVTNKYPSNPKFSENHVPASLKRDLESLRSTTNQVQTGVFDADGKMITREVVNPGGLSWADTKALRTDIGEYVGEAMLSGDKGLRSDMRGLYGALSEDMRATAAAQGPAKLAAFEKANAHFQSHMDRVENAYTAILGDDLGKNPEAAASRLFGMVKDGAATANIRHLAQIRGSMNPDEWGEVQSGLVRMMGQPMKSEGREFSPQTFMNTYGDMSSKAKGILFGGQKKALRKELDSFALVVRDLARSNAMRNTSNTAPISNALGVIGAVGSAPVAPLAALGVLMQATSSYGGAKLWTNPRFVQWATGYTKMMKSGNVNPNQGAFLKKVAVSQPAIASEIAGLHDMLFPPQGQDFNDEAPQ